MKIGVDCPVYGKTLTGECKTCSLNPDRYKCMIPIPILDLVRNEEDAEERRGIISPTQLTGCRRREVLIREAGNHFVNPEKEWRMIQGRLIHTGLNELEYLDALWTIKEKRLYKAIKTKGGIVRFSGKPDLVAISRIVDSQIHITLVDWKTTERYEHKEELNDDYVLQLNMYKWLLESDPEDKFGDYVFDGSVVVDEMTIFIMGARFKRFSSLREYKAKGKKNAETGEYDELTLRKIPVIPNEEIYHWITNQIEMRQRDNLDNLPPILGKEDDYKCRSCPVFEECRKRLEWKR